MKILNLHGLNGSSENTNYRFLSEYFKGRDDVEIISPQLDYANCDPYWVYGHLLGNHNVDIIVGNSFGGFFAYCLGAFWKKRTILVNPCIPPENYIPTLVPDYKYTKSLEEMWNACKDVNKNYTMLLGDSDTVLDISITLDSLNPKPEQFSIISGGHSLSGQEYENWFKEQLK